MDVQLLILVHKLIPVVSLENSAHLADIPPRYELLQFRAGYDGTGKGPWRAEAFRNGKLRQHLLL